MSPSPNNPLKIAAFYKGKLHKCTLKEWSELTGKKYKTVTKRMQRLRQDCRFKNPQRLALFNNYVFYGAMNKNSSVDDLVYPSVQALHERLQEIVREDIPLNKMESTLSSAVPLSESLHNILLPVLYTNKFVKSALNTLVKEWENDNYCSLTELCWKYGKQESTVKLRLKKGVDIWEALKK